MDTPTQRLDTISENRRRVDDVGGLPQRAAYPLPRPHLLQFLDEISEQITQRGQVTNPRLAAGVRHPSRPRRLSHLAGLVSQVTDDHVAHPRSRGQRSVRAGRHRGSGIWLRILRHRDHPAAQTWPT
jgi:hypothetical protein